MYNTKTVDVIFYISVCEHWDLDDLQLGKIKKKI